MSKGITKDRLTGYFRKKIMDDCCADRPAIYANPIQAIEDGLLTVNNAPNFGLSQGQWMILAGLAGLDQNTDGMEALLELIRLLLVDIDATTTDIELNQEDPDLFGVHTITTGTEAAAPVAGNYSSWVVVRTGGTGALTVSGLPLTNTGDSTAEEAQPQFKIPEPTIVVAADATYAWRTKS